MEQLREPAGMASATVTGTPSQANHSNLGDGIEDLGEGLFEQFLADLTNDASNPSHDWLSNSPFPMGSDPPSNAINQPRIPAIFDEPFEGSNASPNSTTDELFRECGSPSTITRSEQNVDSATFNADGFDRALPATFEKSNGNGLEPSSIGQGSFRGGLSSINHMYTDARQEPFQGIIHSNQQQFNLPTMFNVPYRMRPTSDTWQGQHYVPYNQVPTKQPIISNNSLVHPSMSASASQAQQYNGQSGLSRTPAQTASHVTPSLPISTPRTSARDALFENVETSPVSQSKNKYSTNSDEAQSTPRPESNASRAITEPNPRYKPNDQYTHPSQPPASWGGCFKYTKDGELLPQKLFSAEEITQYLFKREPNARPVSLLVGRNPPNSRSRYPSVHSHRCRLQSCPATNNSIGQGTIAVTFVEDLDPDHDPFLNAGYVHLFCLEKFCDFPRIVAQLEIFPDTRALLKEPRGKNQMRLGTLAEEKVVNRFIRACKAGQVPEDYPHFDQENRPYEGTLCHKMALQKLARTSVSVKEQWDMREKLAGYKGSTLKYHLGNLEVEAVTRLLTRQHANQRQLLLKPKHTRKYRNGKAGGNNSEDDNSDDESASEPPTPSDKDSFAPTIPTQSPQQSQQRTLPNGNNEDPNNNPPSLTQQWTSVNRPPIIQRHSSPQKQPASDHRFGRSGSNSDSDSDIEALRVQQLELELQLLKTKQKQQAKAKKRARESDESDGRGKMARR